jgi:hypothetical protein
MFTRARRRHTPEQIVRKLKEADRMLNEGSHVAVMTRHLQITATTSARPDRAAWSRSGQPRRARHDGSDYGRSDMP